MTHPILRWIRFAALLVGGVSAYLVLSSSMPTGIALANSAVFTVAFLAGLRLRAALGELRGERAKELSWSSALLTSIAAVTLLAVVTRISPWPLVYSVVAFELSVFYVIGKATCAVAGCCGAERPLFAHVSLPVAEIVATLLVIAVAACALTVSVVSALVVLTTGHLVIRAASRFLRTNALAAIVAPDIAVLFAAAVVLVWR